MTVSSTTTKNSYSGDGSTTTFAYAFKIFADADLTVILRSAAGTETVQTLTTDYSVTNAGNANGGNVVFVTAPASGVTVVIRRNMAQTQSTDYVANDPFPAATHEDALDRLTFIAQQQQEEVDRSIKLSRTNTMTSTEFTVGATDRANKVLAFDGNGELSVTQELGTYKGTDATVTTEAYVVRDIIKSTTAGQLNNVYICVADAVVGDLLTDTDHFELLVDAVTAATSATNAASSASAAATSESNAATSESNAATSASNAATSESNASTSETNAATSATSASNSATSAASSATTATTKASEASTSATNAATSESNASTSATNAATSATNASTSETNAATSATTATTQASAASTSASNAATSASNASTSETNAAASAAAAAASADTFDDTYLGSKSSDPSLDNDGDALNAGDLYFNTTSNTLKVYTGSAWQDAAIDSSGFVQTTGDTMTGDLTVGNIKSSTNLTLEADFENDTAASASKIQFKNDGILRGEFVAGGDFQLYEDTGTTPKLFWDASAESLGIGTSSPYTLLELSSTDPILRFNDSNGGTDTKNFEIRYVGTSSPDIDGLYFRTVNDANSVYSDKMVILGSGNVGIGTSSPSYELEVEDSSGNAYISIISSNTSDSAILFGDTDAAARGGILYDNADNSLAFRTATNTERMRIDSSGNLLVGKTSTSGDVVGHRLSSDGRLLSTADGNYALQLNRKTSDGSIAEFRKDGTTVGSIGVLTDRIYLAGANEGVAIDDDLNSFIPSEQDGSARDNASDLGSSGARWRNLYLGGGVYLGGTGSANLLDDYEEGTWTPTVNIGTVTGTNAYYTKIGKRVHVSARLASFSDRSNSGTIEIQGLPFARNTSYDEVTGGSAMWSFVNQENNVVYIASNGLQFYKSQSGDFDSLRHNDLNNASAIVYLFATYIST